ncbi:uncharacterized protein LOC122079825 [Macadamia integrifolia]|uniref:uncharacterized protein LOC122079825 n=1 Tax=Macadamia integrifolia TaxID=60698 RepID=UPI001C4FE8CF|nr:uncharacterized protein LOC122079825 [Macadamia integrifolia]
MAMSVSVLAVVISLHLIAFVFAVGAERRRSKSKVMPDEYDERTFCVYDTDAATIYGLSAFGLLLISQGFLHGITKCLCFGRGLMGGKSTTFAIFFFVVSWVSFLGAEACLLAGSARNAYHTKYRGYFGAQDLSCATLRKGVFAAGAALTLVSMAGSILYYWAHARADTGGWQKYHNEAGGGGGAAVSSLGMTNTNPFQQQPQPQSPVNNHFAKV